MAQSNFFTRSHIVASQPALPLQPAAASQPQTTVRTAPADTMPWKVMAYTLALLILAFGAVVYPLSIAGGFLAKSRGNIVAIDTTAHTLTLEENGGLTTIVVREATQLSGHVEALEELEVGDRVLVRYDSVLKQTALEITALRHPSQ